MAFYGSSFTFNGMSCRTFGLTMYDIGSFADQETEIASSVQIVDETVGQKWKPYFYGTTFDKKLEFEIVFGANTDRIQRGDYLSRQEVAQISSWLTGHNQYYPLVIQQDDMMGYHYNAIISGLSLVHYGAVPWALKMIVTCDSPYAYLPVDTFQYDILPDAPMEISIYNRSSLNRLYSPIVQIEPTSGGDFVIENLQVHGSEMKFSQIPASVHRITVNCETCVITNDQDLNLYPNFNFQYLKLARGTNRLRVTGSGKLSVICEFPIDIGG